MIQIDADSSEISGSIKLCYVPSKVKMLRISPPWKNGKMTGTVDSARLPDGMQLLSLEYNQLTGKVDLTRLPGGMQKLFLDNNRLRGKNRLNTPT